MCNKQQDQSNAAELQILGDPPLAYLESITKALVLERRASKL